MHGSSRSVSKLDVIGSNGSASGSPGRSPRLPRSPRLSHRRNSSSSSTGGLTGSGKTLSMENIQSINAAYATGGPMYFTDTSDDPIGIGSLGSGLNPSIPKSTMTLGRAGARVPYTVRAAVMGSSPNINSGVAAGSGGCMITSDTITFGTEMQNQPQQAATVPYSMRQVRDGAMSDLQTQLREVLRENELLRRELEAKESKLSSSMNSIKTFWSPELKKERALRKDEATKMTVWKEQYRIVQDETQHLQCTIQALQDELRIQRDLNQLFQADYSESGFLGGHAIPPQEMTEENFLHLHGEYERHVKELFLLRKTVEEMELRIDTQKHTLTARDESIKKLLEMLQSKGLSSRATEEDHERTRRLADAEMTIHQLEGLLEQRDKEMLQLREELHRRYEAAPESTKTKALQTVIEMKDAKISSMERGMRELEEEVLMLKSNGALSSEEREEEIKQMEVYRSHSKFMKNKVKEANTSCEAGLEGTTSVDALRLRLEEKESLLSKKSQQISDMSDEKSTVQGEITDLKDMLDVKERKVIVLQKKIENLQDQLRDKDKQLSGLKDRVKSLQTDTSNTDTALGTLEEALSEKERIIERLKDQREKDDREKGEEMESTKKELKELREKVSQLQADLADRETSVLDLKEKASFLASSGLKKDSRLKSLEITLEQKKEECVKLENMLKKAQTAASKSQTNTELSERIHSLEQEVTQHREDAGKAQSEVERLLEILREMEDEKNDKEKKIHELERQMKDQSKKVANLKHKEQVEKSKNAQLMEEAKKREDNLNESSQQIKDSLRLKEERIEELEEALRESVQITAEREVVLVQEEQARTHSERQVQSIPGADQTHSPVEDLLAAMAKVKQELDVMKAKLSSTQVSLAEKEGHLTALRAERRKHLEEVLEMKQEALLAAISEKDANIALLELSSSKKKKTQEEVAALKREKDSLVQQLKQQTQNRMKLMADNYEDDHLKVALPNVEQANHHKPSPDQIIPPLLDLHQNRSKLKLYISHLTSLCRERDPVILQDLAPPPAYHRSDSASWHTQLHSMTQEQLEAELALCEREGAELQEYANQVLQQIADRCPDILEQVVNALEDSS
uniref:ELKS/Rab6-interacting/CAST family member 1-like n=1 Tax=Gouania willdenowi TaxID=441366 RepID=A0A8C5HLE0_GOUWI